MFKDPLPSADMDRTHRGGSKTTTKRSRDEYEEESSDEDRRSSKAVYQSASVARRWNKFRKFPTSEDSVVDVHHFKPRSTRYLLKKWGARNEAPDFAYPRPDQCLLAQFEKAKRSNKVQFEMAEHAMAFSGAAAHASLSVAKCIKHLPADLRLVGIDESAISYIEELVAPKLIKTLEDSVKANAAISSNAFKKMRTAVLDNAVPAVKALKTSIPSAGNFFGNPSEGLHEAMSLAFLSGASTSSAKPAASRRVFASSAAKPSKSSRQPFVPAQKRGNARGRAPRGRSYGRGKK